MWISKRQRMELYKIDTNKNCKVFERVHGDNVVFQGMWRRQPRRGKESYII